MSNEAWTVVWSLDHEDETAERETTIVCAPDAITAVGRLCNEHGITAKDVESVVRFAPSILLPPPPKPALPAEVWVMRSLSVHDSTGTLAVTETRAELGALITEEDRDSFERDAERQGPVNALYRCVVPCFDANGKPQAQHYVIVEKGRTGTPKAPGPATSAESA